MEKTPEEWLAEERERRAVAADPGPVGKILGSELASQAEPYVRQVREKVFGAPEPPFESNDAPDFKRWFRGWFRRQIKGVTDPLEEAVRTLVDATGFRNGDVREWIVFGKVPALPRVFAVVNDRAKRLPDGTVLSRRFATLTFHAPVTSEKVADIYRDYVRPLWDQRRVADVSRRRGRQMSDQDYHLHKLMDRMPDASWRERRREWRNNPPPGVTAEEWKEGAGGISVDALRVRWHRLKETKDLYLTTTEDNNE